MSFSEQQVQDNALDGESVSDFCFSDSDESYVSRSTNNSDSDNAGQVVRPTYSTSQPQSGACPMLHTNMNYFTKKLFLNWIFNY